MGKVIPKRERFCLEYLKDLNATQAALRAGYSARTAKVQGSRLLTYADVQARISEQMAKRADRLELKAEDVLRELLRLARVDIAGAFDSEGRLRPIHEIPEDVRRAVAGVDVVERDGTLTTKVRFWDKTRALELLGKHLRLFIERVEHSGNVTLEELVAGSRKAEQEKEM